MHDSECGDGAGEDSDASVPHCHDGRDEERLVAQLGDNDHAAEKINKNKEKNKIIELRNYKNMYMPRKQEGIQNAFNFLPRQPEIHHILTRQDGRS